MIKISQHWKDYELIDCGRGLKFERWGKYRLVRPDPQAIWPASPWTNPDAIYHRSGSGGGSWEYLNKMPKSWELSYPMGRRALRFRVEPTGFKHTGIFPEQAVNWEYIAQRVSEIKADTEQVNILNLFAYTGGATLAAALGGADEVVHVDASKGMNLRAKENLALSGLENSYVRFMTEDVQKFVAREARRGRKYQGIILDPPSYGRGPGGELWKLEDELCPLLSECAEILDSTNPKSFLLLNSYTAGISVQGLDTCVKLAIASKAGGRVSSYELGLAASNRDLVLPCGASALWEKG